MIRVFVLLVFIFLYAPIFYVVATSFLDGEEITTKWFFKLSEDQRIINAFYNSLFLAILSTLFSVILGTLAAYGFIKSEVKGESLFYTPIVIPEITEALSLLLFYKLISFSLGFYSVLIGHIAFNIAFVFVIVKARFSSSLKAIEEASMTLGADEKRTFFKVTVPLIMPGIVAASLIAFTLSWDNLVKTVFTTGPGFQTLPLLIWSQAARGVVSPTLNALTTLMLLVSFILAYFYVRISMRRG
ncbi:MAG: ABC transporter permease [Archaeoglobaceae archaeon]|nr:ABC transporter permease [Archaeoglobaceae archaeon]MDW8118238.1 ABC transporter permease [Archaeoglobaceae archaeon]